MINIQIEIEEVNDKIFFEAISENVSPSQNELTSAIKLMNTVSESILAIGGEGTQMIQTTKDYISTDSDWTFYNN